jgi:hypothetical protein
LTFLLQIPLISAEFPLRHALVVVASLAFAAHPLVSAKFDHLPRPLVPQVARALAYCKRRQRFDPF